MAINIYIYNIYYIIYIIYIYNIIYIYIIYIYIYYIILYEQETSVCMWCTVKIKQKAQSLFDEFLYSFNT